MGTFADPVPFIEAYIYRGMQRLGYLWVLSQGRRGGEEGKKRGREGREGKGGREGGVGFRV